LEPLTGHLRPGAPVNAFRHLTGTLAQPRYLLAFATTTLLATGAFLLMPFGSAFAIHNLGLTQADLPLLFGITGVFSIGFGPLIGKLSDRIGKYRMFLIGSVFTSVLVVFYNNLGVTPFWAVIALNVAIFAGVSARMIPASALMTAIPRLQDRGAFMSINSSVQQLSGGIGSAVAGLIVVQQGNQPIEHYDTLGYVFAGAMAVVVVLMYFVNRMVGVRQETGDVRRETKVRV
ncbi:MAG TPA: MFS transporter, partial [Cytophagales bacterium]